MTDNDPLIGTQLGDYKIADVIGRGGMGRVYRGFDEKLERYAAVKVFDAKGFQGDEIEEYRSRFEREARAIARLRHPNIVGVYQYNQSDNLYYMAMVMIDGRDLRTIIKEKASRGEQLSPEAMLRIMADVAAALDYAHSEGVIHRDVKPSNIMVMKDGHAVLTDFGLVLNVPEGTHGTTFGSVHYIAPEQARDSAKAVPQSDIYSLGIVLYEMLTGRVPFEDQSAINVALKHLSEPPPPPHKYNPDISPELEAVVLRALDKEFERRYGDGNSFVQALETALGTIDEDEKTRQVVIPNWAREVEKSAPEPSVVRSVDPPTRFAIPSPVIATEKDETLEDRSDKSRLIPPLKANRWWNWKLIGAVVLVLLVGFLLLTMLGGENPGPALTVLDGTTAPTEPPTDVPSAAPSSVAVVAATDTDEPTDEPTTESTNAPTERSTATGTSVPPSRTPQSTPTTRPSATQTTSPTETRTADALPVESHFIYDDDSFLLINAGDEALDVSRITFVQMVDDGDDLEFPSTRWNGGGVPINALPPEDCFQIYTTNVVVGDTPESCRVRHKWDQTAFPRWFWVSDDPNTRFEIRRDEVVLGECRVGDGECRVDIPRIEAD